VFVVAGKIARLHFADPIKALLDAQRRVARQMSFERDFLDQFAVEAAEFQRQAAERPNQCKLKNRVVSSAAKPSLLGERQGTFGFALDVAQWVARKEKARNQREVRVVCVREITDLIRGIESAAQHVTGDPHVFHPRCDHGGKTQKGNPLEALRPEAFYEYQADPTESKCRLVVSEGQYGGSAQHDIGEARRLVVAALEAEIDSSECGQAAEVFIPNSGRKHNSGKNFASRERLRVAHLRRIGDILDRATAKL